MVWWGGHRLHGQVLLLDAHLSLRVAVAGWVSKEELKGN